MHKAALATQQHWAASFSLSAYLQPSEHSTHKAALATQQHWAASLSLSAYLQPSEHSTHKAALATQQHWAASLSLSLCVFTAFGTQYTQGCISHTTTLSSFSLSLSLSAYLQPSEHSTTAVRMLMTHCAESQYKKQHGSGETTTQIHRLNNPELDKVQAPPHHCLCTFFCHNCQIIFKL